MTTLLRVAPEARKILWRDYFNGLTHWIRPRAHRITQFATPADFFNQRYAFNYFDDIRDGHLEWYLAPLDHLRQTLRASAPNAASTQAIDLGCGMGSVRKWLRRNGIAWTCTGVDLAPYAEKYQIDDDPQAAFIAHDLDDLGSISLPARPQIAFAVNSLSYCHDRAATLKHLHGLSSPETRLVIVDAYPSPLWTKGTSHNPLMPDQWRATLESAGWRIEEDIVMCVNIFRDKPVIRVSQTYLCRKF